MFFLDLLNSIAGLLDTAYTCCQHLFPLAITTEDRFGIYAECLAFCFLGAGCQLLLRLF